MRVPGRLTTANIVRYLQRCELINNESIIEGDLAIADASRRNINFKVIRNNGPSYLLKQGLGGEGMATVAHEAAVYQLLQANGVSDGLTAYLPHFYSYDPSEHILVLELLPDAENLREHHARRGRFSVELAAVLGKALGTLHRVSTNGLVSNESLEGFPDQWPWILTVHRPYHGVFRDITSAQLQLIKIIQQYPEFCDLLDGLRQGWTTDTLIHHDMRWDNCVVYGKSDSCRKTRVKVVDWELASLGNPCWDVGSIFIEYLSCWLLSIPITGEAPPDHFFGLAQYPLEKMQPAMRSFWQSYAQQMNLDSVTSTQFLLRAMRYGAARLVQTAFEQMRMSIQPTANIICFLQLSLNILKCPHQAIVHLLGIPLPQ